MKNLTEKFGPKLTKEEMKKIIGGKVPASVPCYVFQDDGSYYQTPCAYDEDMGESVSSCQTQISVITGQTVCCSYNGSTGCDA